MAIKAKATQSFITVKELKDGVATLVDGSMRMVLMVSSINFALRSEDEQEAILLQFREFLNSLEFSTQIFIQSRRLDIRPYLEIMKELQKEQLGDLMKIQIEEYIGFIKRFTDTTSIMTKTFFIVVPYSRGESTAPQKKGGILSSFFGKKGSKEKSRKEIEQFEEARSQLEQRANIIKVGLARTGVRAVPLGTDELAELYYKFYNPGETEKPAVAPKE